MKLLLTLILSISLSLASAQSCDSLRRQYDSIVHVNKGLRMDLFLANYKVEKVRYYLNITLRKPTQTKFLKGWIRRAIE